MTNNNTSSTCNNATAGNIAATAATATTTDDDDDDDDVVVVSVIIGRLVKKRKYPGPYMSLAIKVKETKYCLGRHHDSGGEVKNDEHEHGNEHEHEPPPVAPATATDSASVPPSSSTTTATTDQPPMLIFVPKTDPGLKWCHVDSWVQVDLIMPSKDNSNNSNRNKDGGAESNGREDGQKGSSTTATTTAAASAKSSSSSSPTFVNSKHKLATSLRLVKCAPNPSVVPDILRSIKQNEVPFDVISNYCPSIQHDWQIDEILQLRPTDRDRKRMINEICQQLLRKDDGQDDRSQITQYGSGVSVRNTHIKKRYWDILTKMESTVQLVDVVVDCEEFNEEVDQEHNQNVDSGNNIINIEEGKTSKEATSSSSANGGAGGDEKSHHMIYNIPGNDLTLKSFRHPRSRYEYLQDKKWPQINWLLQRMRRLSKFSLSVGDNSAATAGPTPISVLDVGGGRGDIACAIAKEFPQTKVTVVDENQTSLDAGRKYADEMLGVPSKDRIDFVCADFRLYAKEYVENYRQKNNNTRGSEFDFVVAWHACGDLSDIALQFSNDINASYVICPCCYTKERLEGFTPSWIGNYLQGDGDDDDFSAKVCHEIMPTDGTSTQQEGGTVEVGENGNYKTTTMKKSSASTRRREEIDAIQKLAETNDRPEVSRRAMTVINSMRMHALSSSPSSSSSSQSSSSSFCGRDNGVLLESYPLDYSSKNLVLVKES